MLKPDCPCTFKINVTVIPLEKKHSIRCDGQACTELAEIQFIYVLPNEEYFSFNACPNFVEFGSLSKSLVERAIELTEEIPF